MELEMKPLPMSGRASMTSAPHSDEGTGQVVPHGDDAALPLRLFQKAAGAEGPGGIVQVEYADDGGFRDHDRLA